MMAAGFGFLGGMLSAWGQLQQGEAEEKAGLANAAIARQNAEESIRQAQEDERRLRVQGLKTLGDIRASYGASGVTNQGSALEVLKANASAIELDALNVKYEGQVKARMYRQQATMEIERGRSAKEASQFSAAGSLLLGAGSFASKGKS